MMASGAIAAVESAAMDHQLMPWEPVWLATKTLPVMVASQTGSQGINWWSMAALSTAAKKYSFQHSTSERMRAATMPGSATGSTMRRNALQTEQPSIIADSSSSLGIVPNWSRITQITI